MMHSIALNASLENYSYFVSRKSSASFRKVAKKVWQRDNYSCQYCGFQAREYQEIVNLDQNYQNNTFKNMITACCFCTQCFFLESVGEGGYGGGTLVYLPEMSQNQINSFCHVLFCAMVNNTAYKESAQTIYRTLKIRANRINEQLGEGVSTPSVFGQLLIDHQANQGDVDVHAVLNDLRLLPARGRFRTQIERWAAAAAEES